VGELAYIDVLRLALRYLKDAAQHAPAMARGRGTAYYIADVACALEANAVVRGNALYAVEKAAGHFDAAARSIDILLSAIQYLDTKLWMARTRRFPL
jgi:hypothetical protein